MSAATELLERLRRLRPPPGGPAAIIAAPARGEELVGEVEFMFQELDAVQAQLGVEDESARAAAAALEADAREECARILATARQQAQREWTSVLAERRARCELDAQAILADGEHQAAQVRARGRERIPGLVEEVVRRIGRQAC